MKLTWVDVRTCLNKAAVVEEALHIKVDGILSDSIADFDGLPPTVRKVLFPAEKSLPDDLSQVDVVIVIPNEHGQPHELAAAHPEVEFGQYVEIILRFVLHQLGLVDFRAPAPLSTRPCSPLRKAGLRVRAKCYCASRALHQLTGSRYSLLYLTNGSLRYGRRLRTQLSSLL